MASAETFLRFQGFNRFQKFGRSLLSDQFYHACSKRPSDWVPELLQLAKRGTLINTLL